MDNNWHLPDNFRSMKKIALWTIVLIANFLLLVINSSAQSLEKLLIQAAESNLELKVLHYDYLAAMKRVPQVSELPDPEAGIGAFPFPVQTRVGAQSFRLSATQMFPWFGTLEGRKELELARAKTFFERINTRTLDLFYEVKLAYFRLYEIQRSQSIIRRNMTILEALERLSLAKVESGSATAADVLRVQLKIKELDQELEILQKAEVGPSTEINQLLYRSLDTPIVINDNLSFAIIPYDKDTLFAQIEANHPMLRMYRLQQEVSRKAISLNHLNSKPSFGAGLDYIMVNQRDDVVLVGNGRDIVQLRASVKIPLYRKKYAAKEQEELYKIAALDNKKADILSRFTASIEKAFADYESAEIKNRIYKQQIRLAEAAINILEVEYSTKGTDFDELLRLENELINYDLKILKTVVQSHIAKSSIERYLMI